MVVFVLTEQSKRNLRAVPLWANWQVLSEQNWPLRKVNIMKRQTLLLILVAVISLAGAAEAFCQSPQRRQNPRFKSDQKMDVNRLEFRGPERSNAAVDKTSRDVILGEIPDWLKEIIGPMPPGSPGPTFPEPEAEELVTDIMVDILLEQQFGREDYDYDVPIFLRKNSKGQLEGIIFLEGWILIIDKDRPLVIEELPGVDDPAEYEGSDGDDTWDVLQGY